MLKICPKQVICLDKQFIVAIQEFVLVTLTVSNSVKENVENVEQTTPQPASTEQENFTEKDPNYYNQNQYDNQQYDESGAAYPTYPEGNYEEQQQYMSQEQYDQQYGQYDPNSEQGNFEEPYKENQESSEVAKDDQPAAPNQTS